MIIKKKILLISLIILDIILGYHTIKISEKEVVNTNNFINYYNESEAESGGYKLLTTNFNVYQKEYTINDTNISKKIDERSKIIYYIVKSGDVLSAIANKYHQSEIVLKYNNPNIKKYLKIGEKLKITPGNSIIYKVQKGDTLSEIATDFSVKVSDIKKKNNLISNYITLGQMLTIVNPKNSAIDSKKKRKKSGRSRLNVYWPISWKGVNSPFGNRFHPVLKRYIMHTGVDLKAHYVNVYAAVSGVVTYSGSMRGYGKIVILKHPGGYETRYAHLSKLLVRVGQYVKQKQKIAVSGATGRVTGPHLHFEIRKNGRPVNPMNFFK